MNEFKLYGKTFESRLLLGTTGYVSMTKLEESIAAAKPAMITASLRRQSVDGKNHGTDFWNLITSLGIPVLPNTAGCLSVVEAITTANMARETFGTEWVKLELIGDDDTLQPHSMLLVEAARELVRDGFKVLPYTTEDLVVCNALVDVGCEVLMPWAAPIGTALGPVNEYQLRTLRERIPDVPMIVDAGLGVPSHAAKVMEWGFDGVLLNTAVSKSGDPVKMAKAFAMAVEAGRLAHEANPVKESSRARASTPLLGRPFWHVDGSKEG